MVRIVDDLLDVSRITQGKVELRKERLELARLVNAAVELCRPGITASRHTLTMSLPDETVTLDGDPVRLTQVLVNLLNNAIKFTAPGGHIWLIAEAIGESTQAPNQLRVRIRDTGVGISRDLLAEDLRHVHAGRCVAGTVAGRPRRWADTRAQPGGVARRHRGCPQ